MSPPRKRNPCTQQLYQRINQDTRCQCAHLPPPRPHAAFVCGLSHSRRRALSTNERKKAQNKNKISVHPPDEPIHSRLDIKSRADPLVWLVDSHRCRAVMLGRGCLAPGCVKPAGDCEKPPAQKLLPVAFAPPPLPSMGGGVAFRLAISVYETLCPRDCRPPPLGCWNPEGAPPLREPPKPGLDVGSAPIDAVLLSGLGAMRGAVRGAAWRAAKPPGDGTPPHRCQTAPTHLARAPACERAS